MEKFTKHVALFLIGGLIYFCIEIAFRGHSHWTMFVVGGIAFVIVGLINEFFPWDMSLILQGIIGGVLVTLVELIAGVILNIKLGLGIWDYSNMPLNFMGQICLPFSIAWCGLAVIAVILDDYLRYWLFGEEKPHYRII